MLVAGREVQARGVVQTEGEGVEEGGLGGIAQAGEEVKRPGKVVRRALYT